MLELVCMQEYAVRLTKGADLKKEISRICLENHFDTVVVLSAVGCIDKAKIRLAKAINYLEVEEDFEIVSLIGTISRGKCHLHISLADEIGNVIGGHLLEGTIINTTCELVLGVLDSYESSRELDNLTGYDEIVFRKKD